MASGAIELTELSAALDGIGHVLRDKKLEVPRYQRSYAWEAEQVETFWQDLRASFMASSPGYFVGTVVLAREIATRQATIIDGQQRLATTALLLSAIRNEFSKRGAEDRAIAFGSEYLSYRDMASGKRKPRLMLNTQDSAVFEAIALEAEIPESSVSSTKRLLNAFAYFTEQICIEAHRAGDGWPTHLARWAEFLEDYVRVIVVQVPTSSDAFLVFETLNDRGVALTVADLLKNYLFGVSEDRIAEVETAWGSVVNTLEAGDNEQRLVDFLRHYWSSLFGATRERDLYRRFRARVRSPEQAITLSTRLVDASQDYMALVTGRAEFWPLGSVSSRESETLRALGMTQNWPLFLAAMKVFEGAELQRLVRAMIGWSVRGLLVGGLGGGSAERAFCDAAVRIRSRAVTDTEGVLETLKTLVPGDEQFRAALQAASAPNAALTRYLLSVFERLLSHQEDPYLISSAELRDYVVQRILPASGGAGWNAFESEDVVTWSRRLGNFVLRNRGENVRSTSRVWADLRQELAQSNIESNRRLAEIADWTPDEIRGRQEMLADLAVTIWPVNS
jgi:hypothetical protein